MAVEKTSGFPSVSEQIHASVQSSPYAVVLKAAGGKLLYERIYDILKRTASEGHPITYGDLAQQFGLDMGNPHERNALAYVLGEISNYEYGCGRPLLSVLVIHSGDDGMPGGGFFDLAQGYGRFDGKDRQAFYWSEARRACDYWREHY